MRDAYTCTLRGMKKYPYAESLGWLEPFLHPKSENSDLVGAPSEREYCR